MSDYDFPEPPEYDETVTQIHYHNGIEKETDKAILFRYNEKFGFWCPKALIEQRDDYTVSIIGDFNPKPIILYSYSKGSSYDFE